MNVIDRFMKKVVKTESCWNWTARKTPQGYGRFGLNGANRLAHRVAFGLFRMPIQDGLQVLHRCDNPSCVNPDHLWLGTNADNSADKVAKRRQPFLRGQTNGNSKLAEADVLAIRDAARRWVRQRVLARRHEVTDTQISDIVRNNAWRHL